MDQTTTTNQSPGGGLLPSHGGENYEDIGEVVDEEKQPRGDDEGGSSTPAMGGIPRTGAALGGGGPLAPLLPWTW